MRWLRFSCFAGLLALTAPACTPTPDAQKDAGAVASAVASASAPEQARADQHRPAPVREGGAIVRSPSGEALYVADEDHRVVRVLPLPLRSEREAPDGDARALYLIPFLRRGLVPPPARSEPLSPQELRGKEIFSSETARCSKCHAPETDYTDRIAYPLGRWSKRKDYDDDPRAEFKTPSLKLLAGRAPYFHDGSASSIERLIEQNNDRMGRTNHLSAEDRTALIAFLRTL